MNSVYLHADDSLPFPNQPIEIHLAEEIIIDNIVAFFGPIFGVVVADFYYVKNQKINHKELFYPKDDTEYVYSGGWNFKAVYSLIIGFIFSASLIWNPNLSFLESIGWIIGAFISFLLYFLLNNK